MYHFILVIFVSLAVTSAVQQNDTLRLLHVIHRHGDRTPDNGSIYAGNRFTDEKWYMPYGYGQLTDAGKRRMFEVGKLLRKRYDDFLGDVYNIYLVNARTTDTNRTKASIALSLAGLWPPPLTQRWNLFLNWQPIPYNYKEGTEDKELSFFYACRDFWTTLVETSESENISRYLNERYNQSVFQVLQAQNISTSVLSGWSLYLTLLVQEELGLPLDNWTEAIYPEPLRSLAVEIYYVMTNTTYLRRRNAGYFLKQVLADSEAKINGTIYPESRKLFLYSAHEINIGSLVLALDAFPLANVPGYGSHVIFELHEINGVWGFKLFFQDWASADGEPHALTIPGCDHFCPYDQFVSLISDIIPESDQECYGTR